MKLNCKDFALVAMQLLLFIGYLLPVDGSFGFSVDVQNAGFLLFVFGTVIVLLALLQLNKNASPFPTPGNSAVLIQNGLYKWVRHPIYSGIILMLLGYSVYQNSIYKGCITALLMLLFHFKTKYEEQQLIKKFPEYVAYKRKTGKFFLKLF